jgi:hypothetical protein
VISRKFFSTFILFVFCIGLLGSLALGVGAAPSSSYNVGLTSPGANYPSGKDVQPCVGWNSFSWILPPEDEPQVGWNSFSFVFPPAKEPVVQPNVGWNSYSFVLPPGKDPVVRPSVGWNS